MYSRRILELLSIQIN